MTGNRGFARVPFLVVVGLCLLQLAWWVVFQYRESIRIEASERVRLEALCYRALVSIGPAMLEGNDAEKTLRDGLQTSFPELELAAGQGGEVQGVRIDTIVSGLSDALGRRYVRPSSSALAKVLDEARSKRLMFTTEGIAFALVVLIGVVLLYTALNREMRIRRQHESFLAGATHEMKTPLATLRLGLQTLEQGWAEPETAKHYLHEMVGQVDRLRMQIDNLLREASGRDRALNLLPGDILQDLDLALQEHASRMAEKQVQAEVDAPAGPVVVRRDKEAILQVLRNLLDNALKYSPSETRITIRVTANDRMARVAVRDQGPGIAPSDRDHVFEKFYRGQAQPDDGTGGTGLGLFVSKQTALAHGGDLLLCRESDGGACFELRLPRHAEGGT